MEKSRDVRYSSLRDGPGVGCLRQPAMLSRHALTWAARLSSGVWISSRHFPRLLESRSVIVVIFFCGAGVARVRIAAMQRGEDCGEDSASERAGLLM